MKILGVSFDYHDAAAALVVDGRLIAAAQEERFSRVKHDKRMPVNAMRFCLETAGIGADQLDHVVFYERPLVKLDRIRRMFGDETEEGRQRFRRVVANWLGEGRLEIAERLSGALGCGMERVREISHHEAHAASAFYASDFIEAAVITLDGVGETETFSISHGNGTRLQRLESVDFPHSIGLLYSGFTAYLGFEINEGEYKVMGMAAYGQPVHAAQMLESIRLLEGGGFLMEQSWFDFTRSDALPFRPPLVDWLGPPRHAETPFFQSGGLSAADRHYADIAASIQSVAETVILHAVKKAIERTNCQDVCLAGGVALNSVANGRILRELGCRLYVHPAAGDAGGAVGAALHYLHHTLSFPRGPSSATPYLGRGFDDSQIAKRLSQIGIVFRSFDSDEEQIGYVAERLAEGKAVGWLQGRAEWGPRALGNRSILASPMTADMQRVVNEKIKFREPFRPFAPSVLAERAADFFEMPEPRPAFSPEHYMLAVHPVRLEAKVQIPAVTHVDGSARIHLVDRTINSKYHSLISRFGELTGVPVLLNTSFNLRGEPIVDTVDDALATFQCSALDLLALGRHVVERE